MSRDQSTFDSVEEVENLLQSKNEWLERKFREDTLDTVGQNLDAEAKLKLHATVESSTIGESGVVEIGVYSASDLYAYADPPFIDFSNAVCSLLDRLNAIESNWNDDIERELEASQFWGEIQELKLFIGTSDQHDECIATFMQIRHRLSKRGFERPWLRMFQDALTMIRDRLIPSDETLDQLCDIFEEAGFELNLGIESC